MNFPFSTDFNFKAWSEARLAQVEQVLKQGIDAHAPAGLGEAMRYSVLDGGKRLRPLLVLAAAEAVGVDLEAATVSDQPSSLAALRAACAVELIHAYSLVHDDMPCMDNDVLRRGKPTVHVKYGEAQALLAGDALQALAFEFLTPQDGSTDVNVQAAQVALLARASGYQGMAGGQAID
jgi:farnesyl diphosphate synthase